MKTRLAIFVLFVFPVLLNCKPDRQKFERKGNDTTVVCVIHPVKNWIIKSGSGSLGAGKPGDEFYYVAKTGLLSPLTVNYDSAKMYFSIEPPRKYFVLDARYNALDEIEFLIHSGDSVEVSYNDKIAQVSILNRDTKPWDVSFDSKMKERLKNGVGAVYTRLRHPVAFPEISAKLATDAGRKELLTAVDNELLSENSTLDSLYGGKLMSQAYLVFFKLRNRFKFETSRLLLDKDNYVRPDWTRNDTMIYYPFHRMYLRFLTQFKIENHAARITTSNMNIPDYRSVFDSVQLSRLFSPLEKEALLYSYTELVIKFFKLADIKKYLSKFDSISQSKELSNKLKHDYKLEFSRASELHLKTIGSVNTTFSEQLHSLNGQVVFVDFWASWCGPCIAALPASEKLQRKYVGKKVKFLFLSKDEDISAWQRAADKYNLNGTNSFVIDNQYASNMIDSLGIQSIPRYLLYDRNGKLVHSNAPGPGSLELEKIIDENLSSIK